MRHVAGIDAGGTKTEGLLADEEGHVLAEARGGGANLQTHGELAVEKVLHGILEELGSRERVHAVCLGIAGVDRPQDEAIVLGILRRLGYGQGVRVVNDAVIALVAGAPERYGVVVLSGTGSITYGVDPAGQVARAGGYGYLLADEGSGYWLGHQALRAVVRSADGRGPETTLAPLLFEALSATTVSDLVPRVYEQGLARNELAALAGLVEKAATGGDGVAQELLEQAASELALAARAVARRLSFQGRTYPLVLAGGVFKACPGLIELLRTHLDVTDARLAPLGTTPARGAVALALDLIR